MLGLNSQPKKQSSAFSEFMRTASSKRKKRVYTKVLNQAIERQNKVLEQFEDKHQHC